MIGSYLKITFRTLLKHRVYSIINITGLTLSMAVCLMIIIFIKDQKSCDWFNEKRDRIVRVYTTDKDIKFTEVKGYATTPGPLAPYLLNNYPFIEEAVRLRQNSGTVIHKGEAVSVGGLYAEPDFFNIFSYHLKEGNPQTALNEPYSIVLSEETAFKFFGNDDPVNKTLSFEKIGDFTVTGVFRDPGKKSHLLFDALFSFSTVGSLEKSGVLDSDMNHWSSFTSYYTYVLLKNKADRAIFEKQLAEVAGVIFPEPESERLGFKLQQLSEINLGINLWLSMPGTTKSFEIIYIPFLAILIICLVCFNYIILSIAHSLRRAREIGLHKVIGARRSQIIRLFLSETFVITASALVAAGFLILWLIPVFNGSDLVENGKLQINIQQMKDPFLYIIFILFAIAVAILAGLFPALYLSSFQPVNALKGATRIKGITHLMPRKILMGIQFAASLIFIIFIIYSNRLHTFLRTLDYGIDTENLVNVYLQDVNYGIFRNEIVTNSNIKSVSLSNEVPVYGGQTGLELRSANMEKSLSTFFYSVNPEFVNNFNLEIVAGRNFSDEFSTDKENAIILNQEALRVFDLGSPVESIGKTLITGDSAEVMVIGIVKNFIFTYPDEPISALALRYRPEEFGFANIRYIPGKKEEVRAYLQETWKKFDKVHEVKYEFFDDAKEDADKEIRGIISIFWWVCGFVILIALLGLLGMASYTTEIRIKEIGIRKVHGAGIIRIVYLLSKDYLILILYSAVIALPAAYFISGMFYQLFSFRPGLSLWVLPVSLILILLLALMTISSQTIRAALANPSDTLKEE